VHPCLRLLLTQIGDCSDESHRVVWRNRRNPFLYILSFRVSSRLVTARSRSFTDTRCRIQQKPEQWHRARRQLGNTQDTEDNKLLAIWAVRRLATFSSARSPAPSPVLHLAAPDLLRQPWPQIGVPPAPVQILSFVYAMSQYDGRQRRRSGFTRSPLATATLLAGGGCFVGSLIRSPRGATTVLCM
jgi:hypothetical protein